MRAPSSLGHQARLQVQCGKFLPFQNIPGGIGSLGCLQCLLPPCCCCRAGVDQVGGQGMHEQEPSWSATGSGVPILECRRLSCSHPGIPQALVSLGCCRSLELCEGRESLLGAGMAPVCSHSPGPGGHCLLSTGTTSRSLSSSTPAPNSDCSGPGASRPKCRQFQWKWLKWVFKNNNNKTKKTHFFFFLFLKQIFFFSHCLSNRGVVYYAFAEGFAESLLPTALRRGFLRRRWSSGCWGSPSGSGPCPATARGR